LTLRWTWDLDKAKKNLEKHKVSFDLAERALGDLFAFLFAIRSPLRKDGAL
jgi:uncharacterized DUF497 family protein